MTVSAIEREYANLLRVCDTTGVEPGLLLPSDGDDEEFIRGAVSSGARFLVSRDNHLLDLGKYHSLLIVRPSKFMETWRSELHPSREVPGLWQRVRWRIWGGTKGT